MPRMRKGAIQRLFSPATNVLCAAAAAEECGVGALDGFVGADDLQRHGGFARGGRKAGFVVAALVAQAHA